MASGEQAVLIVVAVMALLLFLLYSYIWSIGKVYSGLGFDKKTVSAILIGILLFGYVPIPLFPYNGWIVAISIGGALIPIIVSIWLLRARALKLDQGFIGVVIVSFITYLITRPEPGVGVVADMNVAFIPAIAAAMFALSVYWQDPRRAAPLAFFSGTIGTIVGADIFHLYELLQTPPSEPVLAFLVVGGANIFDMVFISGFVAVLLNLIVAYFYERRVTVESDKFVEYEKDLIVEYEKRRMRQEAEIARRSAYWDRGVPYEPELQKPLQKSRTGTSQRYPYPPQPPSERREAGKGRKSLSDWLRENLFEDI